MLSLTMLTEGGPIVTATLLIGLLGIPFSVFMTWSIGFMTWRIPMSLAWLPATLAIVLGFIGVFVGSSQTEAASAAASPEMRQTMIAAGISISLYASYVATGTAALAFAAFTFNASLPALFAVGPDGGFKLSSSLGAVAGAFVGTMLSIGATLMMLSIRDLFMMGPALYLLPLLTCGLTLAILFASLRESDEREHQGRIAGLRIAILIAAVLAIMLAGEFFRLGGTVNTFAAVAHASAEMKAELMAKGLELSGHTFRFAVALALMPLCAGIGGVLSVLGRVDTPEFVGTAIAGLQITAIVAALALGASRMQGAFDMIMGAS